MSQVTEYVIGSSPLTMAQLKTELDNYFAAMGSKNKGSTAPSNPFNGMSWIDDSATPWLIKIYDTTNGWTTTASLNATTGVFTPYINGVPVEAGSLVNIETITPGSDGDVTLTAAQNQAGVRVLETGSWTSGHSLICDDVDREFIVIDNSGYTATVTTDGTTPTTVDVLDGRTQQIITRSGTGADFAVARSIFPPSHYDADIIHSGGESTDATSRRTLKTPNYVEVQVDNQSLTLSTQQTLDLNTAGNWDSATYATAANRAGLDFYLYYCQPSSGSTPDLILSANSTFPSSMPSGATPDVDNTRKIAGFHCLCVDVGTISGHDLTGYLQGDILPQSVWDRFHRPASAPEGMVYDPNTGLWVDIYLASWGGSEMESANGATIADGASSPSFHWYNFVELLPNGKRLPLQPEFMSLALGSPEETSISGSADPGTTGGHSNTGSQRIISNIGVEDATGVLWQWGAEGGATNDVGAAYAVADTDGSAGSYDDTNSIGRGQHFEAPNRPRLGGDWSEGARCGSRGSAWSASPLSLGSSVSARGVAEPARDRRA